jgi:hypothetical protein
MPYEQALALFELGRYLDRDDPDGRDYLGKARAMFERLGASSFSTSTVID